MRGQLLRLRRLHSALSAAPLGRPAAVALTSELGDRSRASWRRPTLLLGGLGIGLSLLAAAHASPTQCEAPAVESRYETDDDDATTGLSVPLDGERFATIDVPSRATRFSCATYKANFPIEDRYDVQLFPDGDVFALVLDGHGGWQVSEYGRKSLIQNVRKEVQHLQPKTKAHNPQDGEPETPELSRHHIASAIQRGFTRTDRDLMAQVSAAFQLGFGAVGRCGSCALMVYVRGTTLHVANAGDIRAVLGRKPAASSSWIGGGSSASQPLLAVPLSQDQNAMAKNEQERLRREHPGEDNVVVCRRPDSCYVKGALQPTRALGDFALKYSEFNGPPYVQGDRSAGRHIAAPYSPPYITAVPEVRTHELHTDDQFVIIGSDGVWDFLSNEEAVEVVREQLEKGTPELAGRALVERTLRRAAERYGISYLDLLSLPAGSHRRRRHDDTTAVVVFF
ncbi:hypothetical protein P43SY_005442 [Pythium insidiosum]|uniref:PPM-type phosphatase domain-containing protein n=1 Tax=Pythium insidiosum TaxID=114742 RepID=A0AAD5Q8P0_PYTIN|nr:hypothetical protein P43SY_005442 [Pythium insidiosum]